MELDIVNKCAESKGWIISNTHYFKFDGVFNGCNVYRYYQPIPNLPNGMPFPTGLPTYVIVKDGDAQFLDAVEITNYWRSKRQA